MKLHDFPFAPNPRKTRVYLAEKGIEIPLERVDIVRGEQREPEFLAKNPMGGLPVLELDDGTILRESLAIIEYFEELHPEPPMIGTDPLERARVRAIERTIDLGVLGRVARVFHATAAVLPGTKKDPVLAEQLLRELVGVLDFVDETVGARPFVAGERPTIADCTLFAALEMARTADIDLHLEARHPNLARWFAAFSQRPSAKA